MCTHNMYSLRNKKNYNTGANKSWIDKYILTVYLPMDKK